MSGIGGFLQCPETIIVKKTVFLLLFCLGFFYFFQPLSYLRVLEVNGGRVLVLEAIQAGQEFALIYTHSVHKSPVIEVFTIQPRTGLLLKKTGFKDYGVGIPYSTPHTFTIGKDGFFWIENIDEPLGSFTLRVQEIPQQRFVFGEREVNLLELTQAGTLLKVEAVVGPRLKLWIKERVRW